MDASSLFNSPAVTKASPKTKSYDPISGSPVDYDFSGGKYQRMSPPPPATSNYAAYDKPFRSAQSTNSSPYRETRSFAKAGSMALVTPVQTQMFAKTRPRNEFTNPITGEVTRYDIKRSNFRGLDNVFKTHLASSYEPVEMPYSYKPASTYTSSSQPQQARIAGALKKSPELLTYVNPYSLNTSGY